MSEVRDKLRRSIRMQQITINFFYSYTILGTLQPVGKNFTKLRGGTMSSCLKFIMTIYDLIVEVRNEVYRVFIKYCVFSLKCCDFLELC